jgi:predicted Zn finger-like uncharacterized protein
MILVCPTCDAKFKIPDGAIPAGGRTVRCAKCKNSWHATPQVILRKPAPRPAAPRPAPAAPAVATARPPEPAAQGFDGKLDSKAAAEAEALRRSVQGTVGVDATPSAIQSSRLDDEGLGGAPVPDDNDPFGEPVERSPVDDGDDFGIAAAVKDKFGEDFLDDGTAPDGPDASDFNEDADYDEDDFLALRRADQRRQHERQALGRWRKIMTFGWAGLILFWLIVAYGFMFQKENMRHYLPGTAEFVYGIFSGGSDLEALREKAGDNLTPSNAEAEEVIRAVLYHPEADPKGVSIETVDGQQTMVLRGYIENNGRTGANVPVILARVFNVNQQEVARFEINPPGLLIRRGGQLKFTGYHEPVPPEAATVTVDVIPGSKANRAN